MMSDRKASQPHDAGQAGLLRALASDAIRMSAEQLEAFALRLIDALSAAGSEAPADEAAQCRHAAERVRRDISGFKQLVHDSLQQALLDAAQTTAEQAAAALERGAMDLSLLTFEAMERKVLIDNLSQAIDRRHADILTALSIRIAHCMQSEALGDAQNPFRSEVLLKAVADAWGKFDIDGGTLTVVMRQMRPEVFLQLDTIWQSLNEDLIARKVLPDVERAYRQRIPERDLAPPPSIIDRLRIWLAPQGTMNFIESRAVMLLQKTAAHVLDDGILPVKARPVLARLQAPLARVAIADHEFFFDERHPARRLLQALIDFSLGCNDGEHDDVVCTMLGQLVERLQVEQDFEQMQGELERFIQAEEAKLAEKVREQTAVARREEGQQLALRRAENDVVARIENGEVAGFVEDFLQAHWLRVLAFTHGVQEERQDVLPKALSAMDDLIWSVKPKTTVEERKELVRRLPGMLAVINAWLNVIKWNGAERDRFFSTLAEHHAAAMRASAELSARDELQLRMDVVQKASEHQLTRRAQEQQQAALAEFMPLVDRLMPGSWVELVRNNGTKVNCKVVWISPARSRFVFIAPQTQIVFTLGDEALAQALRANRASVIRSDAVIGRALAAALEEFGAA